MTHKVETFSGAFVDTADPQPNIRLQDIAHALSLTCRFGGHCRVYYSVAEHAVLVSRWLEAGGYPRYTCLAGLHHDDSQAFLGDVTRPLKTHLGERYAELSSRMDRAIVGSLDCGQYWFTENDFHGKPVKDADNWALFLEARHLLPSKGVDWAHDDDDRWLLDLAQHDVPYWTGGRDPVVAEGHFLSRHHVLAG